VDAGEGKYGIRQVAVQIFGGMKDGAIGFDSKIDLENPKIKNAAVIDERDDAHNGCDK